MSVKTKVRRGVLHGLAFAVPALGVGVWETIRHQGLHELELSVAGNWIAAGIVFVCTFGLQWNLLKQIASDERKLQKVELEKEQFQSREQMARELHDGLAQSLFLGSVQLQTLQEQPSALGFTELRQTMEHMHAEVRTTIGYFRQQQDREVLPIAEQLAVWVRKMADKAGWDLRWSWDQMVFPPSQPARLRWECQAMIREVVWNAFKHAQATQMDIQAMQESGFWRIIIRYDGIHWTPELNEFESSLSRGNGLEIVFARAKALNWHAKLTCVAGWTCFEWSGKQEG